MLLKVIGNNFKQNIKNYLLFFSCSILTTMIFFVSFAVSQYILQFATTSQGENGKASVYFTYFALIGIANIIFLRVSLQYYLKTRISDYSILVVLGCKKAVMLKMICAEYFSIWLFSFLFGTLLGNVIVIFLYYSLKQYQLIYSSISFSFIKVYGETFLASMILFSISILIILIRLMKSDLSSLFTIQEAREKTHKKTSCFAVVGLGMIGYSFWILRDYTINHMLISVCLTILGCYILISYGGSLFFQLVQLNKEYYYKHILKYSEIFYRFSQNKKTIFIFFIINFIVVFFVCGTIVSSISMIQYDYKKEYPYEQIEFLSSKRGIKEVKNKEEIKVPVIKRDVIWQEGKTEKLWGIKENDYYHLTKQRIGLKRNELFYVSQCMEPEENIACESETLTFKEGKKETTYKVRGSKNEIIFGKEIPYKLSDFVVFSDREFQRVKKLDSNKIGIVQLRKVSTSPINKTLRRGRDKHVRAEIYQREELIQAERGGFLFELISHIFLGVFSLICIMCVMCIRLFSNIPELKQTELFLDTIGIKKKQIKCMITSQCNTIFLPALFLSTGFGVIYFIFEYIYACEGTWDWFVLTIYFKLVAAYLVVELIYYYLMKRRLYKAVEQEEAEDGINTSRTD